MPFLNKNYSIEPGEHGTIRITITGRCTPDEVADIEADCCRRYELVPVPRSTSVIFKSLDGVSPSAVSITPATIGKSYTCVKVDGYVNPFAPVQPAGTHIGQAILRFTEVYQQIGNVG